MSGCSGLGREIGIGMACSLGAGLSTVIGALLVCFAKIQDLRFIAAAISFATGVMLYISFVDLYIGNSVVNFEDAGYGTAASFLYATLCFFGGFPITYGLDFLATYILEKYTFGHPQGTLKRGASRCCEDCENQITEKIQSDGSVPKMIRASTTKGETALAVDVAVKKGDEANTDDEPRVLSRGGSQHITAILTEEDCYNFAHAGLLAGLAIAVHNCPEGIVTFISFLSDDAIGLTTVFAIAIHNIPEGMVVGFPVYYATGSKWKSIMWATISGITEPIGALIGLGLACAGELSFTVFGILFGLISGIMVYVSLVELYPKARKYDPEDKLTSKLIGVGMIIMALSLIVINYAAE